MIVSIAAEYSPMPAGRYRRDGKFNAEDFREGILVPKLELAVNSGDVLSISLDGMLGISSSFLEEVFGGLVRSGRFSKAQILSHLRIETTGRAYEWAKLDAEKYMSEAFDKITN